MQELISQFIKEHPAIATAVAFYAFSAFVSGMPEPRPDSFGYLWLFRTLNTFAGNIKELVNFNVVPGSVVHSKTEVVTSSTIQQEKPKGDSNA